MTILIVITLHEMKAFLRNFLVLGGFLFMDSFHRFEKPGKKPGGLHKILACRGSPHKEIGWRSLYFVLCLFINSLCVCFLFTLKERFVELYISYVV